MREREVGGMLTIKIINMSVSTEWTLLTSCVVFFCRWRTGCVVSVDRKFFCQTRIGHKILG